MSLRKREERAGIREWKESKTKGWVRKAERIPRRTGKRKAYEQSTWKRESQLLCKGTSQQLQQV